MKTVNLSEKSQKILLRIISLVLLMEMLDVTVLNTALPQIAISLKVNPIRLKEILTIYFLTLGVFITVSGWVADRFGEKQAMLFAIALFTASSIGCGLAINLPMLVVFRLLQGIGGAFLMPVGRQIMVRVFSGFERMKAMAKINIVTLLGLALGPLIGGALTTYANWRWIFFVNIPVGALAFYLIYRFLPSIREKQKTQFDLMGFILIGIFLGTLLYLLDVLIDPTIGLHLKIFLFALSVSCLFIYIFYAKRFASPLISLKLFSQRGFSLASIGSFLSRLTLTTQPFLIPLLLQTGYGYTAMKSGLFTVPTILATLIAMFFMPLFAKTFNNKKLLVIVTILLFLNFISFYWQAVDLMLPLLLLQQFCIGFLMPLQTALMNNQAYEDLPPAYLSQGTSVYSVIIQASGSFGIALAALVMIAVIGFNDLQHQVPLIAFKTVFLVQSIYLFFATFVFLYQYKEATT